MYVPDDAVHTMNREYHSSESSTKDVLEAQRSELRQTINILSRRSVRPLRILNLPDEVLVNIFENLREPITLSRISYLDNNNSLNGIEEIKNVRLSCQRLCNTSSHLLIPFLCLDCGSLPRFKNISRYPVISKGVQMVRGDSTYYVSGMANYIFAFTRHQVQGMQRDISRLNYLDSHWHKGFKQPYGGRATVRRKVKKATQILMDNEDG